ncbi:MAG TPA: hypothetical protein VGX23_29945 [Actinocrinis sp.]|nr:hypothetical protein [Actinocrinis sp.]
MLVTLLLAAFAVKVVWWVVAPLVPYLIAALIVVVVMGFIYHRMTRW